MRKLAILAVLAATVTLVGADLALAGGGRGGCGGCGSGYSSCGYSYSSCGYSHGGCGYSHGGCGYSHGGCGHRHVGYCGHATSVVIYGCGGALPMAPVPSKPDGKKSDGKKPDGKKPEDGKKIDKEPISAPATLVVNLPAEATLKVDDYQTTSTSSTRVLTTPVLETGKVFSYTLKAEVIRDGKPVTVEQVVKVRAGEITPVTLNLDAASGVASR